MPDTVYRAAEGQKFNTCTTLTVVECFTCKILYAIPESLYDSATDWPGDQAKGWKLCCPLGHTWWYKGESWEAKLDRERRRAGRLAAERDQAEARARAQKGAATRARNQRDRIAHRVNAGVCPCCQRSFKQLRRHMANQHPNFVAETIES